MPQRNAPKSPALMLTVLALSLTGCATSLPPVAVECPTNLPPPALSEPIPQQTYSARVQQKLKNWHQSLTGSTPTD